MIAAARIPLRHAVALAPLRADGRVRGIRDGDTLWIRWPEDLIEVVTLLRPVPGVEFFEQRGTDWHRERHRLASEVIPPTVEGQPLDAVIVPSRFEAKPKVDEPLLPMSIRLTRSSSPRKTTALTCGFAELQAWAEQATTFELHAVKAGRCDEFALLLGEKLPSLPATTRYSGERLLIPLGFAVEGDLPDAAVLDALGLSAGELALFGEDHIEIVPRSSLQTLTRAGVRQARA